MKTVLFVLLDQFADWESAFLAPALRAGTMPGRPASYGVKYMTPDGRPVRSIGGLRAAADCDASALPEACAGLILGGGMQWQSEAAQRSVPLVGEALARVIVVGAPVTRLYRRISDAQTVSRLMKDTMALGWSGFDMLALSPAEQETMRRRRMFVDAFRNDFDWTRLRALELSQGAALLEAALYVEMVQPADNERLRRRIAGEAIARSASWTAYARALLCARTFCSLRDGALSTRSRIAEDEARLTALLSGPWQAAWPRIAS